MASNVNNLSGPLVDLLSTATNSRSLVVVLGFDPEDSEPLIRVSPFLKFFCSSSDYPRPEDRERHPSESVGYLLPRYNLILLTSLLDM